WQDGQGPLRVLGLPQQLGARAQGRGGPGQEDDAAVRPDDAGGTGQGTGQVGEAVPGRVTAQGGHDGVGRTVDFGAPVGVEQPLPLPRAVGGAADDVGNLL